MSIHGGPSLSSSYFIEGRVDPICFLMYTTNSGATIGPPAKRHLNAVSLNDCLTLNVGLVALCRDQYS